MVLFKEVCTFYVLKWWCLCKVVQDHPHLWTKMRKLQKPWLEFPFSHSIRQKTNEFGTNGCHCNLPVIEGWDTRHHPKTTVWEMLYTSFMLIILQLGKMRFFLTRSFVHPVSFRSRNCHVLEEYFEQRRAGKIKKEDKFMVLCTQPRCHRDFWEIPAVQKPHTYSNQGKFGGIVRFKFKIQDISISPKCLTDLIHVSAWCWSVKNKSWCRNGVANNIWRTAARFATHPQVPWAAPSLFSREECICKAYTLRYLKVVHRRIALENMFLIACATSIAFAAGAWI